MTPTAEWSSLTSTPDSRWRTAMPRPSRSRANRWRRRAPSSPRSTTVPRRRRDESRARRRRPSPSSLRVGGGFAGERGDEGDERGQTRSSATVEGERANREVQTGYAVFEGAAARAHRRLRELAAEIEPSRRQRQAFGRCEVGVEAAPLDDARSSGGQNACHDRCHASTLPPAARRSAASSMCCGRQRRQRTARRDHGLVDLAGRRAAGDEVHDLRIVARSGSTRRPAVGFALDADEARPIGGEAHRQRRAAAGAARAPPLVAARARPRLANHSCRSTIARNGIEQRIERRASGSSTSSTSASASIVDTQKLGRLAADAVVAAAPRRERDARQRRQRRVQAQQRARLRPGAVEHDQRDRPLARQLAHVDRASGPGTAGSSARAPASVAARPGRRRSRGPRAGSSWAAPGAPCARCRCRRAARAGAAAAARACASAAAAGGALADHLRAAAARAARARGRRAVSWSRSVAAGASTRRRDRSASARAAGTCAPRQSTPTASRPSALATASTVPQPQNGSTTVRVGVSCAHEAARVEAGVDAHRLAARHEAAVGQHVGGGRVAARAARARSRAGASSWRARR